VVFSDYVKRLCGIEHDTPLCRNASKIP